MSLGGPHKPYSHYPVTGQIESPRGQDSRPGPWGGNQDWTGLVSRRREDGEFGEVKSVGVGGAVV